MDTDLLTRILEAARLAASPSEAMRIEDLQRDLAPLLQVLDTASDVESFADLAAYVGDFKELAAHVQTQPFDVSQEDDDDGTVTITPMTPSGFHDWLGELERLAQ